MTRLNNVGWFNSGLTEIVRFWGVFHFCTNVRLILICMIKSSKVKQKLESTGCFKAVKVTIDTSELYENHSPHGHQIIFDLDEKLLNLSTHTGSFRLSRILIG